MNSTKNMPKIGLNTSIGYGIGFVAGPFIGLSPWTGGRILATLMGISSFSDGVTGRIDRAMVYGSKKIDGTLDRMDRSLTNIENSLGEITGEVARVPRTFCNVMERVCTVVTGTFLIDQGVKILQKKNTLNNQVYNTYCGESSSSLVCYVVSAQTMVYAVYDVTFYGLIVYTVYLYTQELKRSSQNISR